MKKLYFILIIILGLLIASPILASEKIDNFLVTIRINQDSFINVSEEIVYNFGSEQRHGIFRDIPIKYQARGGNYNLRISDITVTDNQGKPYNFSVSSKGKYKSIKIGDADEFVTGSKTYVINYQIKRAINFFNDYDELYWNATGDEWTVPIEQSKAIVYLPQSVAADEVKKECFAGAYGSNYPCKISRLNYLAAGIAQSVEFQHSGLAQEQGLTVVVGWPKGLVDKPSTFSMIMETLRDNWILFLPVITLIILFYFWYTRGRDPAGRKTIIAQFEAPDNLTPAEVGTIIDETAHKRDISAEIINLAIKGYLKIIRLEKQGLLKSTDYQLDKLKGSDDLKNGFERKLLDSLFTKDKKTIKLSDLKEKFYKDLEEIKKKIYQSIVDKDYFPKSPKKIRGIYLGIGIAILILSWFTGPIFDWLGVISMAISGILIITFSFFMPAKTRKGTLAKEHILGLKEYLRVAEKDRFNFHNAPEKNPQLFEKLLPYAMVLGVEKAWAKQFEGIYNQQPSWYNDSSGRYFSSFALANSLGGFQAKATTTLASRPSSAASGGSGFSGGGFSGGGFGGGSGGSW